MNPPSGEVGYLQVPVLPYLIGQPFDEQVMSLVSTLRPGKIAAIRPGDHVDPYLWQVIITVGPGDRVVSIEQQVEIKLPHAVSKSYISGIGVGCRESKEKPNAVDMSMQVLEQCHVYLKPLVDVECVDERGYADFGSIEDVPLKATLQDNGSDWEQ